MPSDGIKFYSREELLSRAYEQTRLLLAAAALRSAPQTQQEIAQASNRITRNAAYLHPEVLRRLHLDFSFGVRICRHTGSLIVCTQLMPAHGVIYGPLFDIFLSDEQKPEDFETNWNVARLHRPPYLTAGNEAVQSLGRLLEGK